MWDRVADDLAGARNRSLLKNARILALVDVAVADMTIAIWSAKNTYDTWRPVTAIEQADTDRNPSNQPERDWTPCWSLPHSKSIQPIGGVAASGRPVILRRKRHRYVNAGWRSTAHVSCS